MMATLLVRLGMGGGPSTSPRHRSTRMLLAAGGVAAAMSLALVAPAFANGGGGGSGPSYRAVVTPATAAAGVASGSTITLTQLAEDGSFHLAELGSVRITPPVGFVVTGATASRGSNALAVTIAGGSVTVNTVDLDHAGQSATVTVQATIPCGVSGAAVWVVVGHSTYAYDSTRARILVQDPSSQLTSQVAPCSLAFAAQPAAGAVGQAISSVAANPSGAPVQVQLRDGTGSPAAQAGVAIGLAVEPGTGTAGALLGGVATAATGSSGLASFAPTIDRAGHGYVLRASAGPGIDTITSSPFDVSDFATLCSGTCSGSTQRGDTTASISATTNGGVVAMSLGLDDVDCNDAANGFYVSTSQAVTFDVTPAVGRTTITMKLAAASVTKPFFKYQVCFSSPSSTFVNLYGKPIAAGAAGILPWCFNCDKPSGGPCVVAKWFDRDGNVYVKFSVPAGDPRGKI
jgi:hypothetical protein